MVLVSYKNWILRSNRISQKGYCHLRIINPGVVITNNDEEFSGREFRQVTV